MTQHSVSAYTDDDLELLVSHRMQEAIDAQHPPKNVQAWKRAARQTEIENERQYPGFIRRAADGLRVRADGKRITYWREVRGTHSMEWVYDPTGTAMPPKERNYDLGKARAEYDERRKRTA